MRYIAPVLFAFLLITSCANDKKETKEAVTPTAPTVTIDSTLITDSTWGLINRHTDIVGLQSLYGAANIKDERVCGPECADSINVTFIYRDSNKQITVNWDDSAYHQRISFLECWGPAAPYHTDNGMKIGSSLNDLLKLNGKKISFSGFDWDYGGLIQSYDNGKLEKSPVQFQLGLAADGFDKLIGDIALNTDMPEVKKALDGIKVEKISLNFYRGQ